MENYLDIKMFTVADVAKLLGVTNQTIYSYIKKDRLRSQTIGGKRYISEPSIKDFLNGVDATTRHARTAK